MRLTNIFFCLLPIAAFANEEPLRVTSAQPIALAGTTLTFQLMDIVDQRCPADVDCYWEGMVQVSVQVTNGANDPVTVILCNQCDGHGPQVTVGDYTITIGQLEPSMAEIATFGRAADLSDYRLALDVSE